MNCGRVDHEIDRRCGNWKKATALGARGGGEEYRKAAGWTIRSPEARRRPRPRRQTVAFVVERLGAREEEGGGVGMVRKLTLERLPWTEDVGEAGRRRDGA